MKNIFVIISICLFLFICGCEGRSEMRERFAGGPLIMTDQNGKMYVVKHHVGSTYSLTPLTHNLVLD